VTYAVRFENVTKRYQRGWTEGEEPRYPSLRHDLASVVKSVVARKGGRLREPGTLALDGVSFEVEEGESFAVIGPNGAGKSTALKLISRISYPTSGRVAVRGRVASLMEVGSGVHPELTGRENIWLYGQILGMGRADVRRRFDEIVEFSEIAHAIDMPVKFFSSGMQLRLGFSIAAHLEPDVFLVDEALAVGDAGFQAKCVERMTSLVGEGRTLLFVSHNLSAVEAVCGRALFLNRGGVMAEGMTTSVLRAYLDWVDEGRQAWGKDTEPIVGRGLVIDRLTAHDMEGKETYVFDPGDRTEFRFHCRTERTVQAPWFSIGISDGRRGTLVTLSMLETADRFELPPGEHVVSCTTGPLPLNPRVYELWLEVRESEGAAEIVDWSQAGRLRIRSIDESSRGRVTSPRLHGPIRVEHRWRLDHVGDPGGEENPLRSATYDR
jgi:ABC-type polysaccharide/polyol phosphate transport system ATPase subunit